MKKNIILKMAVATKVAIMRIIKRAGKNAIRKIISAPMSIRS